MYHFCGYEAPQRQLKKRGLKGVRLFICDACMGLIESLGEVCPDARWQRCKVHFYRNVFSVVPSKKRPLVSAMLKAIHASEDLQAARDKAKAVRARFGGHEA